MMPKQVHPAHEGPVLKGAMPVVFVSNVHLPSLFSSGQLAYRDRFPQGDGDRATIRKCLPTSANSSTRRG